MIKERGQYMFNDINDETLKAQTLEDLYSLSSTKEQALGLIFKS